MKKGIMLVGMTLCFSLAISGCGSMKESNSSETEKSIKNDTEIENSDYEDTCEYAYWLKNHKDKFRSDDSIFSTEKIMVLQGDVSIDNVLDSYMSWCSIMKDDHPQLSEILNDSIYPKSYYSDSFVETKELADSYDNGPKGSIIIHFENLSDTEITVEQAIKNNWFSIQLGNYMDVYTYCDSPVYINLGYSSDNGKVTQPENYKIIEDYLIKYYGEPNYLSVCMNDDCSNIQEVIDNIDNAGDVYVVGWMGDKYGIFITVRNDSKWMDENPCINFDVMSIVPREMFESANSFSSAPFLENVNDSNLVD